MDFAGGIDFLQPFEFVCTEINVLPARHQKSWFALDIGDMEVTGPIGQAHPGLENRHRITRTRILKEINAVKGLIRTGRQQVHITVAIIIQGNRPYP